MFAILVHDIGTADAVEFVGAHALKGVEQLPQVDYGVGGGPEFVAERLVDRCDFDAYTPATEARGQMGEIGIPGHKDDDVRADLRGQVHGVDTKQDIDVGLVL